MRKSNGQFVIGLIPHNKGIYKKRYCIICGEEFGYPGCDSRRITCSKKCKIERIKEKRKDQIITESHKKSISLSSPKNIEVWCWKGDDVGYSGLHRWVKRWKGKAMICCVCGENRKKVHWANISGNYLRSLDDFAPLCVSCHRRYDYGSLKIDLSLIIKNI